MTQTHQHQAHPAGAPAILVSARPWGLVEQFSLNQATTVEPGTRLPQQRHEHRSVLWQVLDGPMAIVVGDRSWTAQHAVQIRVPRGTVHRMGNAGAVPARILEVAFGHVDEHDIERLQDD